MTLTIERIEGRIRLSGGSFDLSTWIKSTPKLGRRGSPVVLGLDELNQCRTAPVHKSSDVRRILAEHLPNALLLVYSDSSHGAQYQHAKLFLEHVKLFLNESD